MLIALIALTIYAIGGAYMEKKKLIVNPVYWMHYGHFFGWLIYGVILNG